MTEPLISIREAAQHLRLDQRHGRHASQWLRRYLITWERRTGRTVLVPVGDGTKRPTYRVSIARLRLACPELFDQRDRVERAVRGLVGSIGHRLDAIDEALDEHGSKLAAIAVHARKR